MSETKKYASLITELDGEVPSVIDAEKGGQDPGGASRRTFFRDVAAGAAGIAVASAVAELGFPATAMAEQDKDSLTRFPEKLPPWPTGTIGNRYDHLFCTRMKEKPLTDKILFPTISFRGASDLPGTGMNIGFRTYDKPYKMEMQSHHHDVDEYLFFLGAQLPDLTANFDAEIELFLGDEYERHVITKPTVLYIPRGFQHNPMDIKRVGKPMLFMPIHLAPYFNAVYQTGYLQFTRHMKTD